MYRIWIEYQTEARPLGYFVDDVAAKAAFNRFIMRYFRQGYSCDENGEDKELAELMRNIVKGDDMWSLTMMRVPIVVDKEDREGKIFDIPEIRTGMTDMITIHLDLQSKAPVMPNDIPCPDNPIKEIISKR